MTPETLEALRGSIAKWKAIVEGTEVDRGLDNCPLCELFVNPVETGGECLECPVFQRTGEVGCCATPFIGFASAVPWNTEKHGRRAATARHRALAQAELDFLISLLPDGTQP